MRTPLLLTLLFAFVWPGQNGAVSGDGPAVVVVESKWSKTRRAATAADAAGTTPAAPTTLASRNYERNRGANMNDPARARDPNADTVDARSAVIERNVRAARAPKLKPVEGYAYRVKVQNAGARAVEVVFWEYQFTEVANPANVARRQFLCGVRIKPGKEKEMQAFSLSGPSNVVSAGSLSDKTGPAYGEKVVINRVEYADGSIWQRKDWNFAEVREGIVRAVSTPWGPEMCRGL